MKSGTRRLGKLRERERVGLRKEKKIKGQEARETDKQRWIETGWLQTTSKGNRLNSKQN